MKKTKAASKKSVETKPQFTDIKLEESLAKLSLLPCSCAADAITHFSMRHKNADGDVVGVDFSTLVNELRTQNARVFEGDLSRVEAMLLDQSHTLQAIFCDFSKKMAGADYFDHLEAYSRIALKAQNQCRQTLATLGELKNPKRATFIRQQNNAVNQQINQAENQKIPEKPSNEILEGTHGQRLDTRASQEAIRADQAVEAVGEDHRSKNPRGEA